MNEIVFIMGKSASGKDRIYRELSEDKALGLNKITMYTTRPLRSGEAEGREYHFVDDDTAKRLENENKIIEIRCYDTVFGVWKYFTVDDGNIDLQKQNYLVIGTLESFIKTAEYFSKDQVLPIYIEVDDGIRLERAIQRERRQETPKYEEMCRRFLADAADFSAEKLEMAGITQVFENDDLERCVQEIEEHLLSALR